MNKALAEVAKLAPQDNRPMLPPRQHKAVAAEMKALQIELREAIDCLRLITCATKIRGPLGSEAYIISSGLMREAQEIIYHQRSSS